MANWFECRVRYDKPRKTELQKVTEAYLVDALSFTEAEARIIEEETPFISGEFSVSAVKRTKIAEIFWNEAGDKYYLVKCAFITIDEKPQPKNDRTHLSSFKLPISKTHTTLSWKA